MKKIAVSGGRRAYILTMRILMGAAAIITAALVLFLIAYVLIKGLPNVSWTLLSTAPSYLSARIGNLPDILCGKNRCGDGSYDGSQRGSSDNLRYV